VFRRRKNGLLRRAMELSVMANCDVAVLVFHGTTGAAPCAAARAVAARCSAFGWMVCCGPEVLPLAWTVARAPVSCKLPHMSPFYSVVRPCQNQCSHAGLDAVLAGALTQYSSSPIGGMLQRFARACGRPHETYTNEDVRHFKLVCCKFLRRLQS
jgi:hypothetical protein